MHTRTHTSTPLVGETPPELNASGRDPGIDVCRGIALWWTFLDHVPNNIGSWLTLRNYRFSDAAEVFMFISGVTCALACGRARQREGWRGMISRSLRPHMDGSPVAATSQSRDTTNSQRAQLVRTAYLSAFTPRKPIKVVESDTAPKNHIAGLVWAARERRTRSAGTSDSRIYERHSLRDHPKLTITTSF